MEKPLLAVLRGTRRSPPPLWLMRQAGRYLPEYRAVRARAQSFFDLCYDPLQAAEISLQPVRRFGLDGLILFSDILVLPDALGRTVSFDENKGPRLEPLGQTDRLPVFDAVRQRRRLAPVYDAMAKAVSLAPKETTVLGFAGAPWTLAAYMIEGGTSRDFFRSRYWALQDEAGFGRLIDMLSDAVIDHLNAQLEAGADAVQLFDSWAGTLSESGFRRWCVEPARRIVAGVKAAHPGTPVIGFPRGAGPGYEFFVEATDVDAVSLDSTVPLAWAADRLAGKAVLQGNLDPAALVVGGDVMEREATRILKAFAGEPFVFNLGHGVLPQTPPENVAALREFLHVHAVTPAMQCA